MPASKKSSNKNEKVLIPNVPFYALEKGDPGHCLQVATKIVIEYYLSKHLSIEELDRLTQRKGDYWTWNVQIIGALQEMGLRARYYSSQDIAPFIEGEAYMRRAYPGVAEKAISKTDMPVMIAMTKKTLEKKLFAIRKVSLEELEDHLRGGNLAMVSLDWNVMYHRPLSYGGHMDVMVGFDAENVYLHESNSHNPEPYKKVPKADFNAARAAEGIDFDVILIDGKR